MTLLTPLGLLGLLGIAILILIYIIKPNYQQKMISSTYVWKLSLKYRKKRIPTSKLRNILIIICQILILTACALFLAQPNVLIKQKVSQREVILMLDSSASMRTEVDDESRYERAVNGIKELGETVLDEGGVVSVIVANSSPYFLVQRLTIENKDMLTESLEQLISKDTCSYSSANVNGAIALCENISMDNPDAQLYLYTDMNYSVPKDFGINFVNVSLEEEWNAAILSATTTVESNSYVFTIQVASYGVNQDIQLNVDVYNANAADKNSEGIAVLPLATQMVRCEGDAVRTVIFKYYDTELGEEKPEDDDEFMYVALLTRIYSYKSVHVSLNENDSFSTDNAFDIYGGQREVMKIQYYSTKANTFFYSVLLTLKNEYKDCWDIQIDEVKQGNEPLLEGYDFYIFEHQMPEKMPTDGIVFLVDPDSAPANSGFRVSGVSDFNPYAYLSTAVGAEEHPIMHNIQSDKIQISAAKNLIVTDPAYEVLMMCGQNPALMVKNMGKSKVIVLSVSMHYSNASIVLEFPLLIRNVINYFMPSLLNGDSYEVGEEILLSSRGEKLEVSKDDTTICTFDTFPASFRAFIPGIYTFSQDTYFSTGVEDTAHHVVESVYVKIPSVESNIKREGDTLNEPYKVKENKNYYKDLLLIVSSVLVALVFIEWLLQMRESM